MTHEIKEWKGKPILILKKGEKEKWGFTFGMAKAKLIVQHFKEIEEFVRDYEKPAKADLE